MTRTTSFESEALALQGGRTPTYGVLTAEEGVRQLRIDEFDNAYTTYKSFAPDGSYTVELGKHRLVVLNSKYDSGIPPVLDLLNFLQLAAGKHLGVLENVDWHPATQKAMSGRGPDSSGLSPNELDLLRKAVADTGDEGVVIAAIHCPPFHQKGHEYPYYQRETIHPTAASALTEAYVQFAEISGDDDTWPRTGTEHFKVGDLLDGLDDGFLAQGGEELIDICVGNGLPRPVDLVLYGHHHARVEHRLRMNASGKVEYFMDFYTENPERYYSTTNLIDKRHTYPNPPPPEYLDLPTNAKIVVRIVEDADKTAVPRKIRYHSDPDVPATEMGEIDLPPYSDPLAETIDAKAWWAKHRPLFAQTASLGPIDERQRFGRFWKLDPPTEVGREKFEGDVPAGLFAAGTTLTPVGGPPPNIAFAGFRFIRVQDGAISVMRYISLDELRASDFKLPWEPEGRPIVEDHPPPPLGGLGIHP